MPDADWEGEKVRKKMATNDRNEHRVASSKKTAKDVAAALQVLNASTGTELEEPTIEILFFVD